MQSLTETAVDLSDILSKEFLESLNSADQRTFTNLLKEKISDDQFLRKLFTTCQEAPQHHEDSKNRVYYEALMLEGKNRADAIINELERPQDEVEIRKTTDETMKNAQKFEKQQKLLQESIKQISEEIACLEEAKKLKQEEIQKNNLTLKDFSQRIRDVFKKARDDIKDLREETLRSLEYSSATNFKIKTRNLNELMKNEREFLNIINIGLKEIEDLKSNDVASKNKKDTKVQEDKDISFVRDLILTSEKELLMLELSLKRYKEACKHVKAQMIDEQMLSFSVSNYKTMDPAEYSKLEKEQNILLKQLLENYLTKREDIFDNECENNGCNMLAAEENRYLVARLENEIHDALAAQENRLAIAEKSVNEEQDAVQAEYDILLEHSDRVQKGVQTFSDCNEKLESSLSKSGSELIVPTSNQQLISLGRRLGVEKDGVVIKEDVKKEAIRINNSKTQNSNILKEHLDEALPKEQKQKIEALTKVVETLKDYDAITGIDKPLLSLQENIEEQLNEIRAIRSDLEMSLNKVLHGILNTYEKAKVDPKTKISERDIFQQYICDKHPVFLQRLSEIFGDQQNFLFN